ncbi:MAG: hypothetical protein OEO19_12255 [Gammaproteobacteria bacterium]|nr:hypothetical protein [Gammaproteobacteria bacterium]MDH3447942.1 hypothetical protein [Gammaproteobacteria bacterium]
MSLRSFYEKKMRDEFDELKAETIALRQKAEKAEVNLELEYFTLLDELHVRLESAEQKLELLKQANEADWEHFKSELEHSWQSLRELIRALTAP